MATNEEFVRASGAWSRLRQDIGVIVWCGFLAACFATMFFFAIFDPVLLMHDEAPPAWLADRRTAYAIGFFFFWSATMIAAALTAWLIDTNAPERLDRS